MTKKIQATDKFKFITERSIRKEKYELTRHQSADLPKLPRSIYALDKTIEGLDKKLEVGFTKWEGQINTLEAKLDGKIDKLDERTKLGFWGFIFRGTALAAFAALTAIFVKYLFPILPTVPKL